ncbi:MAG: hypothetical protein U9O91_03260 [Candidatus Caldatribacteriota bacterium]|nr:hypothetical protein [Candidatus Caldatribacteriota bacterium]
MKKKVLLLVLIIFLISILAGCGAIPCDPEWDRTEQEVYSYWQAIINRQYDLARCYCIIDGIWYNKVDEWEEYININSEGEASVVIYEPVFYEKTEVIGGNATVYTRIITDITPFPGSNLHEGDLFEYEIELIRQYTPPGDWKLK